MNFLTKGLLYYNTLKFLKASQIIGRIRLKLRHITPDNRVAPDLRVHKGNWQLAIPKPVSMVAKNQFCFLNHCDRIHDSKSWQEGNALLWLYNLHYFDDLNAVDADNRQSWHHALIERWIYENPAGCGVGWEPYPQSLRIVNWVKWHLSGHQLSVGAIRSLAIQTRYLTQQIEWHLLGNHLFANAKALVFAGVFFDGAEADDWLRQGMEILADQVSEQILTDGGHFERSPMYHAIIFEDLLDLLNLTESVRSPFENYHHYIAKWRDALGKMYFWLEVMSHPDGEISFFNDAAFGIAALPSNLFRYARQLGIKSAGNMEEITYLECSGYIRVNKGNAVLLIDVAPIGPDYLPGHAHADTLSFELSLDGKRVIINSGTSQYGVGRQRDWERSTAAHNTLEINQQSSSETWAGFRVARRAYPKGVNIARKNEQIVIEASHNGYYWLSGKPVHNRTWSLGTNHLTITDRIDGRFSSAISRIYFHPGVRIKSTKHSTYGETKHTLMSWANKGCTSKIVAKSWCPEFGRSMTNYCLENMTKNNIHRLELNWIKRK